MQHATTSKQTIRTSEGMARKENRERPWRRDGVGISNVALRLHDLNDQLLPALGGAFPIHVLRVDGDAGLLE
jgi:hypothetical protein